MKTTLNHCNILLFMLLLTACSATDDGIGEPGDMLCPIAPVTQLPGITAEVSRSGAANYDATFFRIDAVKQWSTDGSFNSIYGTTYDASATSSFPATVSISGSTTAMTIDPVQYYQLNDCSTKMFAVHPAIDGENGVWDAVTGTATFTIDGDTDIMVTNVGESKRKGTQPTLTFTRQLSRINVKLYIENRDAIDVWKQVQVVAKGVPSTCKVIFPQPDRPGTSYSTIFSGSGETSFLDEPVVLTEENLSRDEAIDGGTSFIYINERYFTLKVINEGVVVAEIPVMDERDHEVVSRRWQWEAGKTYTIYLKLNKNVWFDLSVTPWITDGNDWGTSDLL